MYSVLVNFLIVYPCPLLSYMMNKFSGNWIESNRLIILICIMFIILLILLADSSSVKGCQWNRVQQQRRLAPSVEEFDKE